MFHARGRGKLLSNIGGERDRDPLIAVSKEKEQRRRMRGGKKENARYGGMEEEKG